MNPPIDSLQGVAEALLIISTTVIGFYLLAVAAYCLLALILGVTEYISFSLRLRARNAHRSKFGLPKLTRKNNNLT